MLAKTQIEVLIALYNGAETRAEIANFSNFYKKQRKEGSTCARVAELRYYITSNGKKLDPITFHQVEKLALNKHGIKAVQRYLTSSEVAA